MQLTQSEATRRAAQAQQILDGKTKPLGALGQLETLGVQLCVIQNTLTPSIDPVRALIFGADHGVAAEGVSLFPAEVTAQMMANFASGGAAICVLTRSFGVQCEVLDVGVNADLSGLAGIVHAKVARGSGNLRRSPALTPEHLVQAMGVGAQAAVRAFKSGIKTLVLGEMGIGNTTSAAALICAYTGASPSEVVGAGTGVSGAALALKTTVVAEALTRTAKSGNAKPAAREILAELGGLEIAALAGAMIEAHTLGLIVLVDGFIVTAAALAACQIEPATRANLVFAHRSAERGHSIALGALNATPLLDLGLRLGEGSGAALAVPLVRAAAAIINDMASFADAGVSNVDAGVPHGQS
jgi:nicotinate-nucleotide--dimethylbenzimidazole phosphoribosyltransferase